MGFKQDNNINLSNISIFRYGIIILSLLVLANFGMQLASDREYSDKIYSILLTQVTLTNIVLLSSLYLLFKQKIELVPLMLIGLLGRILADYDHIFLDNLHSYFTKINLYIFFGFRDLGTGFDPNYPKMLILGLVCVMLGVRALIGKIEKDRITFFLAILFILLGNLLFNHINKSVIEDMKTESRKNVQPTIAMTIKSSDESFFKLCEQFSLVCVDGNIKQNKEHKTSNEIADKNIPFILENLKDNGITEGGIISSDFNNNAYSGFVQKNPNGNYRIMFKIDDLKSKLGKWEFWKSSSLLLYNLLIMIVVLFLLSYDYKKTLKDWLNNR